MIREVVLLAFREGVPSERLRAFETAFTNLRQQIDEIRELEWGLNASRENLAAGFSHCFLVTFDNLAARDRYVDHPDYRAALAMMEPWIEKRLVVDYKPRNGVA
jgi:hypothetical protein